MSNTSGSNSGATANVVPIKDAVIRIAGNSQDGIQTVGELLARYSGRSAQEVMSYMTIPATIGGGPSIYQVRIGSDEVLSVGDEVDVLVAFYQHSYEKHIGVLRNGGVLIYDPDQVKPNPDDKRFTCVGVPMTSLTIEAVGGKGRDKGKNMFLLGLIARMFDLDMSKLEAMLKDWGARRDAGTMEAVFNAFRAGYAFDIGRMGQNFRFIPNEQRSGRTLMVMAGNQAMAYGLIAAGVRFGAAYPITPSSQVMEIMRAELPKYGGIFLQAEDEIAAVCAAIGASYGGRVAVTSTLNIAVFGGHGDCPRIVIAPRDVEDAFYISIEAVNLAREYSCPVIILSDQAIGFRVEAFEEPDLSKIVREMPIDFTPRGADFKPYEDTPDGVPHHPPPGTPIANHNFPILTGLEHNEAGHPGEDPKFHATMTAKRRRKLQKLAEKLPTPEVVGPAGGDTLLVSWGSSYGPAREAAEKSLAAGEPLSALCIRYLNPLPPGLDKILDRFKRILVVENNDSGLYGFGQLAGILRSRFCNPRIGGINKTDGLSFKVREILDAVHAQTL
ncbi:MAG: 2-oxoacid:acceptor oxidoreductase family protein [Verrucomicrobia bacterium]|nr:2-oxoacid:acceptor oxidoreductase family protein [Verrucomicrobiota bacterium]